MENIRFIWFKNPDEDGVRNNLYGLITLVNSLFGKTLIKSSEIFWF